MKLRLGEEILDLSKVENSLDDFHYKGEHRDEITEGRNHDPLLAKTLQWVSLTTERDPHLLSWHPWPSSTTVQPPCPLEFPSLPQQTSLSRQKG